MIRQGLVLVLALVVSSCGDRSSAVGVGPQPAFPEGAELKLLELTPTSVSLAWPAASKGSSYRVLQNGAVVADELSETEFVATGLKPSKSYSFTVVALGPDTLESQGGLRLMVATASDQEPLDPGPAGDTDLADQLAPIYIGPDAPQVGLDPDTIDPLRLAAVRGRVTDPNLVPIPGVKISIRHHPELGYTLTDLDGEYTLVVNGGGQLAIDYDLEGFLPAQRRVDTVWGDILWTDPVVLVANVASPRSTIISGADITQRITGAEVIDADGTRQPVALILPGTEITLARADGTSEPLTTDLFSITEYTVGESGVRAMPGLLPAASAFTYAASFDAESAGPDDTVVFSQTVPIYVDNFLDFPVGEELPSGYYDREHSHWVPVSNGLIIAVLGSASGVALLDTDGDGVAETSDQLEAQGITFEERAELASIYPEPTTVWRMPVDHFTSYDFNAGLYLPGDATFPENDPRASRLADKDCEQAGSIIECQNQVVAEAIGVAASDFALHYTSATAFGRTENRTVKIPVSGAVVPASCNGIFVEVFIAGQRHAESLPCAPNQEITFVWNGFDAWGNRIQGERDATVRIGYAYGGVDRYGSARELGAPTEGGTPWRTGASGSSIEFRSASGAFILWGPEQRIRIGSLINLPENSIGGWTLTPHHRRDRSGRRMYFGDGTRNTLGGATIRRDIERIENPVNNAGGAVAVAPNGSIYFTNGRQIFVRHLDGTTNLYAGRLHSGEACAGNVDDPLLAEFGSMVNGQSDILDLSIGPDESLYVTDGSRIQRIFPNGRVRWVAAHPECPDPLPVDVTLLGPTGGKSAPIIDVDGEGGIYIALPFSLRRLSPSGELLSIQFLCSTSTSHRIVDVAAGPEGRPFISCGAAGIRRPSGTGSASWFFSPTRPRATAPSRLSTRPFT